MMAFFFKAGINMGLNFNITEKWAVYLDLVSITFGAFLNKKSEYVEDTRYFSTDIGGPGFIYRF